MTTARTIPDLTPEQQANFWKRIEKRASGCWEWTGPITNSGYGRAGSPDRTAHRISYQLAYGAIPNNKLVLHKCDNKICVNPDHLYAGTSADNARDRIERHRLNPLRGEQAPWSKLTAAQVQSIRAEYKPREVSTYRLAAKYGVSPSAISAIVRGERWACLSAKGGAQ